MSRKISTYSFLRFGLFAVAMASSFLAKAQLAEAPEAVHVICIAEKLEAFNIPEAKMDMAGLAGLGAYFLNPTPENKTKIEIYDREYKLVMNKVAWRLQGLWARSLGTGFVVSADKMKVLTSYDIASSCPLEDGQDESKRRQIAILSKDGLRPIRATALGISSKFGDNNTPLPKFICKTQESFCSKVLAKDVQDKQLKGKDGGLFELRYDVKYWVPDLVVLNLVEQAEATPVMFSATDDIKVGTSLRYSGFPWSLQQGKMGVSNTAVPGERAKPTVQPATFSREISIDTGADQIVAETRRVKASWLELSGATIELGNSGAPLYDPTTGEVVGLVIKDLDSFDKNRVQTGGKAVPSTQIKAYLTAASADFTIMRIPAPVVEQPPPSPPVEPTPATTSDSTLPMTLKQHLFSGKGLSIAALLTLFVGMLAYFVFRPGQNLMPVSPQPDNFPDNPVTPKPTKPQHFATLRCAHGPLAPQELLLPSASGRDTLTVGRDPSICQVVFPDSTSEVSGVHCKFSFDASTLSVFLEDLRSSNGTYVNKRQLRQGERVKLQSNDLVALGRPDSNVFVVTLN